MSSLIWNSSDKSTNISLSGGGLILITTGLTTPYSSLQGVRANIPIPLSGFTALEFSILAISQNFAVGFANKTLALTLKGGIGADKNGIGFYPSTGNKSQLPQSTYLNGLPINKGIGGLISIPGDIITFITDGNNLWISTGTMRKVPNFFWNNSFIADPIKNIGGYSFKSITTPIYPIFTSGEKGGICQINGGPKFSPFLTNYMNIHNEIKGLNNITPINPDILDGFQLDNISATLG